MCLCAAIQARSQVYEPIQPVPFPVESTNGDTKALPLVLFTPQSLNDGIKIPQFKKMEIGVQLPEDINTAVKRFIHKKNGEQLNPFDSAQVDVWMEVTNTDQVQNNFRVNGFYYEEFKREVYPESPERNRWRQDSSSFCFRIRFAHGALGNWTGHVHLKVGDRHFQSANFNFSIVPSDEKGFVTRGFDDNPNDKYLRHENGETYFPIGETVAYTTWTGLQVQDFAILRKYMQELHDSKANMIRLWMNVGSFLIEREKIGDYGRNYSPAYKKIVNRQTNAWELDRAFDYAQELDLTVMLAVFGSELDKSHPDYGPQPLNWDYNPYHNNLNLEEPWMFYYDSTALVYAKKRMRYVMARWGYDQNWTINEITGEPSKIGADGDKEIENKMFRWINAMSDYVHQHEYSKLTLIDFANSNKSHNYRYKYWAETSLDFASVNDYNRDDYVNFETRWDKANAWRKKPVEHKPFIFAEFGSSTVPNLDYATDIPFHNTLWSSSFNGSAGPGIEYWWDRIHADGAKHQHNFKALSVYFKDLKLHTAKFEQDKWKDGTRYRGIVAYYLKSEEKDTIYGWAHNTNYSWINIRHTDPDVKLLIDSCAGKDLKYPNGRFVDQSDNNRYCDIKKFKPLDQAPEHINGETVKIKGVQPKSKYKIVWYNTHGEGGELKDLQQELRTKSRIAGGGTLKFEFPALSNETYGYQDFGFKIYLID